MQIAVLIIGLPIFLAHWLWAQRLARRDPGSAWTLRRFYLYFVLGACLVPFLANTVDLIEILLSRVFGETSRLIMPWQQTTTGELVVASLVPMVILPLVGIYHGRVLRGDIKTAPMTSELTSVRRLFVLIFSAVGLVMTSLAVVQLGSWIIQQIGATTTQSATYGLGSDLAALNRRPTGVGAVLDLGPAPGP